MDSSKDVEEDRQAIRDYLNRWARVRSRDGDAAGAALLTTAGCMIVLGSHLDREIQGILVSMAGAQSMGDDKPEREPCDCCGGEGSVPYYDHPETWGEDCPTYADHLITCPECGGSRAVR